MQVQFLDLKSQFRQIEKKFNKSLRETISRSDFILGQEEKLFEKEFAVYCGTDYAVGLNSGTDALFLSLAAMGIGKGDEVIVPAFTFIATANAVSYTGAKPVFVDIDEKTYNIDPAKIERAVTRKTKAVIPVHLFGQCCDMAALMRIARSHRLKIVEDACQAHGAVTGGRKAGAIGDCGAFSFYPTKNLGGWGDGGMVTTDDKKLYERLVMLRDCGRTTRYEHVIVGYNSRLDTIQAGVLRLKLPLLDDWNKQRMQAAHLYDSLLKKIQGVAVPVRAPYSSHVFHIYAVRTARRDRLVEYLKQNNIGVMVHYPIPLHLQKAYKDLGYSRGDFPAAEKACQEIISLPMHPALSAKEIRCVCRVIQTFMEG